MDAANGSRLQIPSTKCQKRLTTDYADSTDEKEDSFVIRAIRVIRGLRSFLKVGIWNLGLKFGARK